MSFRGAKATKNPTMEGEVPQMRGFLALLGMTEEVEHSETLRKQRATSVAQGAGRLCRPKPNKSGSPRGRCLVGNGRITKNHPAEFGGVVSIVLIS